MQNPVRRQASVTLPGSKPFECPDSYLIERQNQKKVVLVPGVWQSGCKLLQNKSLFLAHRRVGLLSCELILVHRRPRVTEGNSLFRGTFPHEA